MMIVAATEHSAHHAWNDTVFEAGDAEFWCV